MLDSAASIVVALVTAVIGPTILHALNQRTSRGREAEAKEREASLSHRLDRVAEDAAATRDNVVNHHASKFRDDFDDLVGQVAALSGEVRGLGRKISRNEQHFSDLHDEDDAIEQTLSTRIANLAREMRVQRDTLEHLTERFDTEVAALQMLVVNVPIGGGLPPNSTTHRRTPP